VLVPVEVFFDVDRAAGTGRTALRLVLVDARLAEIRWSGEVKAKQPGMEPDRTQLTDVATRLADLVTAP
jgi:hypothetical protein